jgi:REP element-mobilizing transposase RayT
MSSKYRVGEDATPHFVTFSVVGWVDVFSRQCYKELFVESLQYCQDNKGLILHAWIIMTNHVHLIISSNESKLPDIVRDLKKYTSKRIIKAIQESAAESRSEWMMNIFSYVGKNNNNNKEYQFWKQDYHPIELSTAEMMKQRLDYLHENPVRSGLVWEAWHHKYSSAIDYYTNEHGLIKVDHLQS